MSYDRVLPPLPEFRAPVVTAPSTLESHSLRHHKIMTNQSSNAFTDRTRSLAFSQKRSSPTQAKGPASPDEEFPEDYEDSPMIRSRRSSQASNAESQQVEKRLPSVSKANAVSWQGESPSQICLCQPDPKVPRPRNAFILYRQHNQAAVVARNPGLTNPEISKVIGDLWRGATQETRNHWKLLAEEEKLRHQKQYPDYRYQPRRSGRSNSISNSPASANPDAERRRCHKCGGRSMATPTSIMSTPGPSAMTPPDSLFSPHQPPSTPSTGSSAQRFQNVGNSHPGASPGFRSRPTTVSSNLSALQLASPRFKRDPADCPLSPDTKRRRPNGTYNPTRAPNAPLTPYPFSQRRRESLPRPEFMPSQNNGAFTMAPPPRPLHHPDSLTLPPLQTSSAALGSPVLSQAKSLEAMVQSIPILNKIRVLAKISPPLPPPGFPLSAHHGRGFVIAIDGYDSASVSQITDAIFTSLAGHHPVRVFRGPEPFQTGKKSEDGDDFQTYLDIISEYHRLSSEIASYVAAPASPPRAPSPPISPVSPKTIPPTKPVTRSAASQQKQERGGAASPLAPAGAPVALLPSFQLSHSDASASCIPITDQYAPVDHWQWMATLWRGIVGPDVTVAVAPTVSMVPPMSATSTTGNGNSEAKSMSAYNPNALGLKLGVGVEVRLDDARAIVVRSETGRGESGKSGVTEGVLRRVGFEVSEWVRGREEGRRGS